VSSVQGRVRPAGITHPAGKNRSERKASRPDDARHARARNRDNEVKRIALLAAALIAALSSAPSAQGTFRAGVEVVSLNVTVVDTTNHYVTDLDEKNFSVFEDGVKQDLSFFTRKQ